MNVENPVFLQPTLADDIGAELREVVMGLHWDPPEKGAVASPGDLDALCVMLDQENRIIETVHPGHPRNANGSVVHTGDSRTGASAWDDERIFVFLDVLPSQVSMIAFVVVSANGETFDCIRGASCHISDRITEHEWMRTELTSLAGSGVRTVAGLQRHRDGWRICAGNEVLPNRVLQELQTLIARKPPEAG